MFKKHTDSDDTDFYRKCIINLLYGYLYTQIGKTVIK